MKLLMFQVDAFTDHVFGGNPAAVIVLNEWLPDDIMQNIAMENNLSETAFLVKSNDIYDIRWFTPAAEVDLCGHATLASAFVLFRYYEKEATVLAFGTRRRGMLQVTRDNGLLTLNFPADNPAPVEPPEGLFEAIGKAPVACLRGKTDYLLVYKSEADIRKMKPQFSALRKLKARGVIITAPGKEADFVSRFFAPGVGIDEDPVTGSAHTMLIPYWAARLKKTTMDAQQLSARVGHLQCALLGDRVLIGGQAKLYMRAEIQTDDE